MWQYIKLLQYPIDIKKKDLKMAKYILSQYGGPQGEIGASLRYLSQRQSMPDDRGKALLNDIGTEELGHAEMLGVMFEQLTKGATIEEMKEAGFDNYYIEHGLDLYPESNNGSPFNANGVSCVGNYIANLVEDMAAESKAKAVYEHLIDLTDDEDVKGPLLFLRQREVVHYNRFKDLLDSYRSQSK